MVWIADDNLINTPLQRGAGGRASKWNRFSGFSLGVS